MISLLPRTNKCCIVIVAMKTTYKYIGITIGISVMAFFGSMALQPSASALECGILPKEICDNADKGDTKDVKGGGLWQLLLLVLNIMTAGVILLAIAGVVYGSVLYTSAGGNQEQVKKARTILTNVVIGVLLFVLMFGLANWLIPGGVFNAGGGLQ